MSIKQISRVLCDALALGSSTVFADEVFRVDFLQTVNGVEKPVSVYVNQGQQGVISIQAKEDASGFDATVKIDPEEKEGFFSIRAVIVTTDAEGVPGHAEVHSNFPLSDTPVVVGGSTSRSTSAAGVVVEEALTISVSRADLSAIPFQTHSH